MRRVELVLALHEKHISIHSFRRECDIDLFQFFFAGYIFQSTHSAGNATRRVHAVSALSTNFNPRIPQGMRHFPH